MRITPSILGACALALASTACGKQADEFPLATPDVAGLSLELAGGAAEGLGAEPGGPVARLAEVVTPTSPDELASARAALLGLNGEVRRVLEGLAAVAQRPPTSEAGDVKTYGPAVRCLHQAASGACLAEASLRLAIRHHQLAVYSWLLEARPVASSSEADWRPVLAGWMARSAEAHRGRGRAAFDLENLHAVAPGYPGRGWLLAGFGHSGQARSVAYKLVAFTPDAAVRDPVTAGLVGHRTAAGLTRVRVVSFEDVVAGTNPRPREVVLAHLGWQPGVGGRGYLVVSNWSDAQGNLHGDVPFTTSGTDHYYFGRGCWGPGGAPRAKEWRYCARGLGPAACLATAPIAVEPAGASWATTCTGFAGDEPLPSGTAAGAEQATDPEPASGADAPPTPETPPTGPGDVAPPAG